MKQLRETQTGSTEQIAKKRRLKTRINVWSEDKINDRIREVETELERKVGNDGLSLSKPRKKLLRAKLIKLRQALAGERTVGGQLAPSIPLPRRTAKKPSSKKLKKECLCCRKRGHTLAECKYNLTLLQDNGKIAEKPGSAPCASLCFNCGSSSHTLKNCSFKRAKDGSLPFASCFVCSEKGHLAQQCPRNKTGIYPRGGGCHICNSSFHLMRDCPQFTPGSVGKKAGDKVPSSQTSVVNEIENDAYWGS